MIMAMNGRQQKQIETQRLRNTLQHVYMNLLPRVLDAHVTLRGRKCPSSSFTSDCSENWHSLLVVCFITKTFYVNSSLTKTLNDSSFIDQQIISSKEAMITSETKLPIISRVLSVMINTKSFAISINTQVMTYMSEAANAEAGLSNL